MGTNYYWHANPCQACGHSEETIHIGKSSAGWTFSFHGMRAEFESRKIESYRDWLDLLESGGVIRDEYGDTISLTDFKALVESKEHARLKHMTYCLSGQDDPHGWNKRHAKEHCWLDPEGHSFSEGEFS